MTDATEPPDDTPLPMGDTAELYALSDPLRQAFEAMALATDMRGKIEALKRTATELATPIRHGFLDFGEIEQRLFDLAASHGLCDELTQNAVEKIIFNALSKPALSEEPATEAANGNGGGAWEIEPPPDDTPPLGEPTPALPPIDTLPLTLAQWAERELPPPDCLLGHWLTTTSRGLLVGPTGLGKTNLLLQIGLHVAAGEGFLHWQGRRVRRVLYVDGEMSRRLLKKRLAAAVHRLGHAPVGFHALSHEDIPGFAPLNTPEGQACVNAVIERIGGVDLAIFDSVMCLIAGKMKDEDAWAQTMPYIRKLTARGIGQLWGHHTGHDESRSYGDKTKEWQLDLVLFMETVRREDTDVSFNLEFRKAREREPETRADFQSLKVALVNDEWLHELSEAQHVGKASPLAQKFLDALVNVLASDMVTKVNGRRAATDDDWKVECTRLGLIDPEAKPASARTLFAKYRRELVAANRIACEGKLSWIL